MTEYKVIWEIEIDADSFEDAAKKALEIQQDSTSDALEFIVEKIRIHENGSVIIREIIDLFNPEQ